MRKCCRPPAAGESYTPLVLSEPQSWVVATRLGSQGRVTISDVAREAGVNKGTVSRALRGFPGVGASTRERILEAANRLNFSASQLASALATGQSKTVGIVLPTLRSWYFSAVASGASEVLSPAGFRVELINLDIDSDYLDVHSPGFRQLFGELGAGRGRDALLFAGTVSVSDDGGDGVSGRVPAAAAGMPLTSVPGIFIDHRAGGRMVGQHLLAQGHRRFAILDGRMPGKPDTQVWEQRTAGLQDALTPYGCAVRSNFIIAPGDCHAEDGERGMRTLLASAEPLPTAVFCHTDELAFGALAVLRRSGIECPGDVSVAGFDDHPMSQFWGLTTISQHAHEQGQRAARALIDALELSAVGSEEISPVDELRVGLVVRETTAAINDPAPVQQDSASRVV